MQDLWARALDVLRGRLSPASFETPYTDSGDFGSASATGSDAGSPKMAPPEE